ncbi:hypothetical protein ABZ568_00870 [Streptomyces olindensis]|uniref:Uncharacterized protein n=1 Tax=Streptomyces olindensis TaxID=358823 RepID=A0ABV2XLZ6_9ACTN
MTNLNDYDTPDKLRAFLKLCLDPGHGIQRSPEKLAEVLPEPLLRKVVEFAPLLGVLRDSAVALDQQTTHAFRAYADALAAWIHAEEPNPQPERYVIGRNGVFATLYDRLEECLVVDNSTEDHCRKVRDGLLAAEGAECVCGAPVMWLPDAGDPYGWKHSPQAGRSCQRARPRCPECHMPHTLIPGEPPMCRSIREHVAAEEPKQPPAARRSLPLMEAVAVAYDAATEHAAQCGTCWPGMRLAEMCADGQAAAIASLDTVPTVADCAHDEDDELRTVAGLVLVRRCAHCGERLAPVVEPECAHLAWEVTSEYRNARQMWVKSRKCADCGDRMDPSVEPEPHWPEKAGLDPTGEPADDCGGDARIRRVVLASCPTARDFQPVEAAGEPGPLGWTFATGRHEWTRYGAVMADGRILPAPLDADRTDARHKVLNEDARVALHPAGQ